MAKFNLARNGTSDTLYIVMSGISGGKDEPFVQHLFDALKEHGSVVSIQFANDPLYHDDALPDMNAMSIEDYFAGIDEAIEIMSRRERQPVRIILVAHSFSAVIATYYFAERVDALSIVQYALIAIDNDDSVAALAYIDSLDEDARKDKFKNPFSQSTTAYMRAHKSADTFATLAVPKLHIDASEVGADHEFQSDESKRSVVEKILAWRL